MIFSSQGTLAGNTIYPGDDVVFKTHDGEYAFKVEKRDKSYYLSGQSGPFGATRHEQVVDNFSATLYEINHQYLATFLQSIPNYRPGSGIWRQTGSVDALRLAISVLFEIFEQNTEKKTVSQHPDKYPLEQDTAGNKCLTIKPPKRDGTRIIKVRRLNCKIQGGKRKRRAAIYR